MFDGDDEDEDELDDLAEFGVVCGALLGISLSNFSNVSIRFKYRTSFSFKLESSFSKLTIVNECCLICSL